MSLDTDHVSPRPAGQLRGSVAAGRLSSHGNETDNGQRFAPTHQLAQTMLEESAHFVAAVTRVAEQQEVVASEDIFASCGMKLVNKGTRLSGDFYDRLVAHKLLKPIEQTLVAADIINAETLLSLALNQARQVPSLATALDQSGLLERLRCEFGELRLPAPLAFRLTVTQADRPEHFQHLLTTVMLSTVLGIRGKLPRHQRQALVLASLFHDAGELAIDPAILAQGHQMTGEECRHLYTHPITGSMMLQGFPEIPEVATKAVLQHHELLDGSGYPFRLQGTHLGVVSRYLAVAEATAALMKRFGLDRRIRILLNLNRHKFDAQAIAIIRTLFSDLVTSTSQVSLDAMSMKRLVQASQLFDGWAAVQSTLRSNDDPTIAIIIERMADLRRLVLESGIDPSHLEGILLWIDANDPETCLELATVLDELEWRFKALSREVQRSQFDARTSHFFCGHAGLNDWLVALDRYA